MAKQPKRVAVIGLDGVPPLFLEKHINEGFLPNIKRFITEGTWLDDCLTPLPTVTPPNWATIATGAWPGTHGVTDFHRFPQDEINLDKVVQNWSSKVIKAETMWEAADKAGKKSIVFNYPGGWPSKMEHGVVVGSMGFTVGEAARDGLPHLDALYDLFEDSFISTSFGPNTTRIRLEELDDQEGEWVNCPDSMGQEPLEAHAAVYINNNIRDVAPIKWFVLVRDTQGKGYDSVTVSPTRDFNDALFILHQGEWSSKIVRPFLLNDGTSCNCMFRCKCMELSQDGGDLKLFVSSPLNMDTDWASKPGVSKLLFQGDACLHIGGSARAALNGMLDWDTWAEVVDEHSRWMGQAVTAMLTNLEWDVFFMHSHPLDWMYHVIMGELCCGDPVREKKAWDIHRKVAISEDRLVGEILSVVGKDTLVALVSDHGAVPDGPIFDPVSALEQAGLLSSRQMTDEEMEKLKNSAYGPLFIRSGTGITQVEVSKSQAVPECVIHVNINLKGRYAHGTVEPEDYEKVQQQVVDALLTYRDVNGERPVSMALAKQEARWLGLYGDTCGDVVYALKPVYASQHGPHLPSAKLGECSLNCTLAFLGHGIKKNHRISKPVDLVGLVPTLCFAAGFPYPADCEGPVIYDALLNPNFYVDERAKVQRELESMEKALSRGVQQPWEKHDCA